MDEENEIQKEVVNQGVQQGEKKPIGFSVTSMVLGIVGLVTFCLWYLSILCGILAIVFGVVAKKKEEKNGMATAGLVMGIIIVALWVILLIFSVFLGFTIGLADGIRGI